MIFILGVMLDCCCNHLYAPYSFIRPILVRLSVWNVPFKRDFSTEFILNNMIHVPRRVEYWPAELAVWVWIPLAGAENSYTFINLNRYIAMFFSLTIFTKGTNACDILWAFLDVTVLPNWRPPSQLVNVFTSTTQRKAKRYFFLK